MPDLLAEPYLIAGLWVAAVAWSVWVWVPVVVAACGGTTYRNGGTEDPAAVEPDGTDPEYDRLYAELRNLGYEPVGPGFMRLTCSGTSWVYETKVRAFRSRAAGRFAFLQQTPLFPWFHEVIFATCWTDRGLLLTFGGTVSVTVEDENLVYQAFPTYDPPKLERRHAQTAARLEQAGWRPDPDLSLETLLRAAEEHATPTTLVPARAANRFDLFAVILPTLGLTGLAAWWVGFWHWAGPAVWLGGLTVYRVMLGLKRAQVEAAIRNRIQQDQIDRESGW